MLPSAIEFPRTPRRRALARAFLRARFPRPALCLIALSAVLAPPAFAQREEIRQLAAHAADRIQASGKKKIVVADFTGPRDALTQFGRVLADDFSTALAGASKNIEVLDRASLSKALGVREKSALGLRDEKLAAEIGQQVGTELLLIGSLDELPNSVVVNISLFDVAAGRFAETLATSLLKSEETRRLLAQRLDRFPPSQPAGPQMVDGAYLPYRGGVGSPRCLHCPDPSYTEQARRAKISGVVVLGLVVTPEGRAKDIKVVRSLGYGLDEAAVDAVEQWTFIPGNGPDGKPVPVRVTIEVTFKLR